MRDAKAKAKAAASDPRVKEAKMKALRAKENTLKLVNEAKTLYEESLFVKVKLTLGFLQLLGIFGLAFQVSWPPEYEVVVREADAIVNLSPIGPVSPACIFPGYRWTWHHTMVLKLTSLPEGYPNGFDFPAGITPNTAGYNQRGWVRVAACLA